MSSFYGSDRYLQRLRSIPIKVHWAGFESDTFKMQQAGWEISAMEDVASCQLRLAFARDGGRFNIGEPNKIRGITSSIPYDYRRQLYDPLFFQGQPEIVAEIQAVGSRVHLHEHGPIDISSKFHPVDCTPQVWSGKITGLDDYAHFVPKGNVVNPEDIVVPEEGVEELLKRILEMQAPAKRDRATAAYYEERQSGLMVPKVAAKILYLKDAKAA